MIDLDAIRGRAANKKIPIAVANCRRQLVSDRDNLLIYVDALRSRLEQLQTCPSCGLRYTGCEGEDVHARLAEAEREQDDMHRVRLLLYAERDALKARLAEAEALLEIVAPLAYAQWKSGSCDPVEAVVSPNEPVTGNADSATGATNAKP